LGWFGLPFFSFKYSKLFLLMLLALFIVVVAAVAFARFHCQRSYNANKF